MFVFGDEVSVMFVADRCSCAGFDCVDVIAGYESAASMNKLA